MSDHDELLLIPGPTPVPPEALAAMSAPMVNHRGEAFGRMLADVLSGLQQIFQTTAPVLPFTASGTGGLEAAVVNVLSPGDRVLALTCGVFGDRFAEIARAFGAEVIRVEAPWGAGVEADQVADALRRHENIAAVLVTHNETSTGVANRLPELADAVRPSGALLLVDAVSSLGALELQTDAWGLDVVVSASQKALMAPPGLAFVSAGARAWDAVRRSHMPRHYFSFEKARAALEGEGRAFTPFTPAIPAVYALHVSVPMVLAEGLGPRVARHRRLAEATRAGLRALGLELFPHRAWASDAVTAVRVPPGVDAGSLLSLLRTEHGVVVAGGQGRLEGQIIRIGHMGHVHEQDIQAALAALERALGSLGFETTPRGEAGAGQRVHQP